ncbi:MAG: hypothetical protein AABX14_05405 [Candidatus Aenigmatarchaeota archaeon]
MNNTVSKNNNNHGRRQFFGKHKVSSNVRVLPICYDTDGNMHQTAFQTYIEDVWRDIYVEDWTQYNRNRREPNSLTHEFTAGYMVNPHLGIQVQQADNVGSPGTTCRFGVRIK